MPARRVTKKKTDAGKGKAAGDAKPNTLDQILAVFKKKPKAPEPARRRPQRDQPIPPP